MRGSLAGTPISPADITIERLTQLLKGVSNIGECWIHEQRHHTGYTYARIKQQKHGIHRIMKTVARGQGIPARKVIDHLCRNRACVNPKHLEITTQRTNCLRGDMMKANAERVASITHCKDGHPFNKINTYRYGTQRQCRICNKLRERMYRRNKK